MIFEQPEEEDRESLPIKKPNRDRMKPTIAQDEQISVEHLYSMKGTTKNATGAIKINLKIWT